MDILNTLAELVGLSGVELIAIVLFALFAIVALIVARAVLKLTLRLFIIGFVVIGGLVVGLYVFFVVLGG